VSVGFFQLINFLSENFFCSKKLKQRADPLQGQGVSVGIFQLINFLSENFFCSKKLKQRADPLQGAGGERWHFISMSCPEIVLH
jgi:hypothetical protein